MITIVTSFNEKGFNQYGKNFIASFIKYWPLDISLLVYAEGVHPAIKTENITVKSLLDESPRCNDFLIRHKGNKASQGAAVLNTQRKWKNKEILKNYNFRYDAYKFCRKPFAIQSAMDYSTGKLFWIDADVITTKPIKDGLLDILLPDDKDFCYLGRESAHSECGFMGFNLENNSSRQLINQVADIYDTDEVFDIYEWHDSYIYDHVRLKMGKDITTKDISIEPRRGHVFDKSILGEYMMHLKGDLKLRSVG